MQMFGACPELDLTGMPLLIALQSYLMLSSQGGRPMASITIRNLDDALKQRLRMRAAEHGRSMEEEVREILRRSVGRSPSRANLGNPSTSASPLWAG